MTTENWQWWASDNEDQYCTGPWDTREDAIADAVANDVGYEKTADGPVNRLHICEALMFPPARLADYLDLAAITERADEKADDAGLINHDGDGILFDASEDQFNDLSDRLKRACDEWQHAHNLVFQSFRFQKTRNEEFVTIGEPTS